MVQIKGDSVPPWAATIRYQNSQAIVPQVEINAHGYFLRTTDTNNFPSQSHFVIHSRHHPIFFSSS